MASHMHNIIGRAVWRSLPESDIDAWGLTPEIPPWAPDFLRTSAPPATVEEKIGLYSLLLDLVGWKTEDIRRHPEFMVEDRIQVPHGTADRDLHATWPGADSDPQAIRRVLRWFIPRLIAELREGRNENAALTGCGILAHYIEDFATLGHAVSNSLFYDMMPDETELHCQYHLAVDALLMDVQPVKPQILANSTEGLVFAVAAWMDRIHKMVLRGFHEQLAHIHREYAGREIHCSTEPITSGFLVEINRPIYQETVGLLASLLHTALAISQGREGCAGAFDLRDARPYHVHPGGNYGVLAAVGFNIDGARMVPLMLDAGAGPRKIENGIGLTSFVAPRYQLEPGAFQHFEGRVGLSAEYRKDQEEGMSVEFSVWLGATWETITPMDLQLEPPMRKALSLEVKPGPSQSFSVELGDAETLFFGVLPVPFARNGSEYFPSPHVVLAEPRLVP